MAVLLALLFAGVGLTFAMQSLRSANADRGEALKRAKEHIYFDLIEMSMVDTWAATGAGAFSLSENGLYTVEGWKAFLSALTPTGLLTVSRWHSPRCQLR